MKEKLEMETNMDYNKLCQDIVAEFPDFKIIKKTDSSLMTAIDIFLRIITLNSMKIFMDRYITTLGFCVYVPGSWDTMPDIQKYIILAHEHVHMKQRQQYGMFLFSMLYVLVLPSLFTYRAKFEKEAYETSIRLSYQAYGIDYVRGGFKDFIISQFNTSSYFWMDVNTKSLNVWYDDFVNTLEK